MKTISELLANLRGVVETDEQIRASDLFRSMEVAGFDPAHPIKVRKSDGLLICGYHRTRCAKMLGHEPARVLIDCTDEEAVQIAVRDNTYTAPITLERRKAIARELHPAHTMQAIGEMLNVAKGTVSKWLADVVSQGNNASRAPTIDKIGRKNTGRPKKAPKPKQPPKVAPEVEKRLAEMILDQGKTHPEAEAEVGVSSTVTRRVLAAERARREAELQVDPATLSPSAQEKLAAAFRQKDRLLQRSYHQAVRQAVQEQVAATLNGLISMRYKDLHAKYDQVLNRRRGQGMMSPAEYRLVLSCLHPDSRGATSERKIAEAFGVIQKYKLSLVSESVEPTPTPHDLPKTAAEWAEAKRKATEARRAKRNGAAVVSR